MELVNKIFEFLLGGLGVRDLLDRQIIREIEEMLVI